MTTTGCTSGWRDCRSSTGFAPRASSKTTPGTIARPSKTIISKLSTGENSTIFASLSYSLTSTFRTEPPVWPTWARPATRPETRASSPLSITNKTLPSSNRVSSYSSTEVLGSNGSVGVDHFARYFRKSLTLAYSKAKFHFEDCQNVRNSRKSGISENLFITFELRGHLK